MSVIISKTIRFRRKIFSTKVNIWLIMLIDLLGLWNSYDFLIFTERFNLKLLFKFQDLFIFAFATRCLVKLLLESAVDAIKMLLFLLGRHKEDVRDLRVAHSKLLQKI